MASSPVVFFQIGIREPATREFFRELFGWDLGADNGSGAVSINTHDPGDIPLNGTFVQLPETRGAHVSLFVRVEDLDGSVARAQELGGQLLVPRRRTEGGTDFTVILGPEGLVVGIVQE